MCRASCIVSRVACRVPWATARVSRVSCAGCRACRTCRVCHMCRMCRVSRVRRMCRIACRISRVRVSRVARHVRHVRERRVSVAECRMTSHVSRVSRVSSRVARRLFQAACRVPLVAGHKSRPTCDAYASVMRRARVTFRRVPADLEQPWSLGSAPAGPRQVPSGLQVGAQRGASTLTGASQKASRSTQ